LLPERRKSFQCWKAVPGNYSGISFTLHGTQQNVSNYKWIFTWLKLAGLSPFKNYLYLSYLLQQRYFCLSFRMVIGRHWKRAGGGCICLKKKGNPICGRMSHTEIMKQIGRLWNISYTNHKNLFETKSDLRR
jgi:hypothetical protein